MATNYQEDLVCRVTHLEQAIEALRNPCGVRIGATYVSDNERYVVFCVAGGQVLMFGPYYGNMIKHPVNTFHDKFVLEVNNEA